MCPSCGKHLGTNEECVFCQDVVSEVRQMEKFDQWKREDDERLERLRLALLQEA